MANTEQYAAPITAKGHTSVVHVKDDWYVVCLSSGVKEKPVRTLLYDIPLVLFRDKKGGIGALLDRCPHRNVPLSLGTVKDDVLECSYHGWRFDKGGVCRLVPGLIGDQESRGRNVQSFPVREQDGVVWLYATPDTIPVREPFSFPLIGEKGYTTVYQELEVDGSIHAVAENALDVPHTAYLHGGLFRSSSGTRRKIDVTVKRFHDRVEAEYFGEPRPAGIAGKILAPGGGVVTHVDRFLLPSIAQVEYHIGTRTHLCVTNALTPVRDFQTKLFTVVSLRLPVPGQLVTPFLKPLIMKIFCQDEYILKFQSNAIRQFGGEQFVSTEIDVLGPNILRLLKEAERGERNPSEQPFSRTLQMRV